MTELHRIDDAVSGRFWSKVSREGPVPEHVPGLGACWVWIAGTAAGRYGKFRIDGVHYGAHRVAWALTNGHVPGGYVVMHKCDNMRCVRPDHLQIGTEAQNVADRNAKGRQATGRRISANMPSERGIANPSAKLTDALVRKIRAATGKQVDIAARFGVDQTTISKIRLRKSWSHVTDDPSEAASG